jgi:hypothetical protein
LVDNGRAVSHRSFASGKAAQRRFRFVEAEDFIGGVKRGTGSKDCLIEFALAQLGSTSKAKDRAHALF